MRFRFIFLLCIACMLVLEGVQAQEVVRPIHPPKRPLPAEEASAGVTRFSYLVYGDTRGRRDGIETQYEHSLVVDGMMAAIKRLENTEYPVRFVLQTGDAVFNGGDPHQWNTSFIGLIDRLTADAGVPFFMTPGNHDLSPAQEHGDAGRQQRLRIYLSALSQLIPAEGSPRRLKGYPTYAFGYGNTFVIAVDSNIAPDGKQFDWVKSQLEGLDQRRYTHRVVLTHQPVFSSALHGGATVEPQTVTIRTRYMPLFRAHHVNAVFSGHDHVFEHWVENYSDTAGRHRMDLIVSGGGGAPPYSYRGEPDLTEYVRANPANRIQLEHLAKPGPEPGDNPYHFLIVRVDGDRTDLEVVGVDWGSGFKPYRSNRTELRVDQPN
jgi:hypothetical protein